MCKLINEGLEPCDDSSIGALKRALSIGKQYFRSVTYVRVYHLGGEGKIVRKPAGFTYYLKMRKPFIVEMVVADLHQLRSLGRFWMRSLTL